MTVRMSIHRTDLLQRSNSPPQKGFTLAEILVALVISSMVLLVFLSVHRHVQNSAASVVKHLQKSRLTDEVHQLIAGDLDKHAVAIDKNNTRVRLDIRNKREKGMPVARLVITTNYFDKENKEELLEEIIWQASYDFDTDSIVLYRSHNGLVMEDRLLDQRRDEVEALYPFVPVCSGLTTFKIEVFQGGRTLDTWQQANLPDGIRVMLSFAEPMETPSGEWDVAEEDLITRVIAIDRVQPMTFQLELPQIQEEDI